MSYSRFVLVPHTELQSMARGLSWFTTSSTARREHSFSGVQRMPTCMMPAVGSGAGQGCGGALTGWGGAAGKPSRGNPKDPAPGKRPLCNQMG